MQTQAQAEHIVLQAEQQQQQQQTQTHLVAVSDLRVCAAASCQLRGAVSNIVAQQPGQNGDSVFAGTTMAGDVYEIRMDYKACPGAPSSLLTLQSVSGPSRPIRLEAGIVSDKQRAVQANEAAAQAVPASCILRSLQSS